MMYQLQTPTPSNPSWLVPIADAIKGAKQKGLWAHAASTGAFKSTFATHWIYNQAVYHQHSTLLFSLEMPCRQVRCIFYALHSGHEKFTNIRKQLGLTKSLDYGRIRDGELTDSEQEFLSQHVVPDFNDPANNYGTIHMEVADPTKPGFTVADLQNKAEVIASKDPSLSTIFVDHVNLMSNTTARDLKQFAMHFKGVVVALFQISREGFKAAEMAGGQYSLEHISTPEDVRYFDIVTATYVDDALREANQVRFQCLKN